MSTVIYLFLFYSSHLFYFSDQILRAGLLREIKDKKWASLSTSTNGGGKVSGGGNSNAEGQQVCILT